MTMITLNSPRATLNETLMVQNIVVPSWVP